MSEKKNSTTQSHGRIDHSPKSTSKARPADESRVAPSIIKLMIVLVLVLLAVALWNNRLSLSCANVTQCARDSMTMCGPGEGFPSTINGSHASSIDRIGGGIALLSDTSLTIYNSSAREAASRAHFMSSPAMKTSGRYAVLVDLGSTDYRVETISETIAAGDAERSLISCAVSQNCRYALVMQGSSYGESWLSSVEVFDREGTSLHKWHCADWYITDAALSADGQYLAMAGVNSHEGELSSAIIIHRVGNTEQVAEHTLNGNYYLSLEYNSAGTLFAVGSTATTVITEDGTARENITHGGSLTAFDICYDGGVAICVEDEITSRVTVYDARGRERCSVEADFAIRNTSLSDEACAILGDGNLMLIRLDGTLIGREEANATTGGLLLVDRRPYTVDGMRISSWDIH